MANLHSLYLKEILTINQHDATPVDPSSITISRVEYDNLVGIWVVAQTVFVSSTNNRLSSVWLAITSLFEML